MTPRERRLRSREEMVAAILQTARDITRQDGVAALNLNEVARRLGMKTPSLYEYFPSKADIYDALFRLGFRLFEEQVASVTVLNRPFWEVLGDMLEANLRFAADSPELYELLFQRPVPGFVPSDESMALSQRVQDQGEAVFRAAMERGEINTSLTTREVRDLVLAMMAGLGMGRISNDWGLPHGQGRFGSLSQQATGLFRAAWAKETREDPTR